ncbi:hypothetical protein ACRARS_001707 [Yersinia enterocolitica]
MFASVFDPMWHSLICALCGKCGVLNKEKPVPLKGKILAKSLLILNKLGRAAISFSYVSRPK